MYTTWDPGRAAADALALLRSTPKLRWSAAGRVGNGTHVGKVMDGEGDSDILGLVNTSFDDIHFIAAVPAMLAGLVDEQFNSDLISQLGCGTVDVDRARTLLGASTPGVWRLVGTVEVTVDDDELDVTGALTVLAADGTAITTVHPCSLADLAAVELIVQGRGIIIQMCEQNTDS